MELDVETDFDEILKNDISESVFFHEYIHFLQDIFTTYGINNIRNILLLLRDKIAYMKKEKSNITQLPVIFDSNIVDDINKQVNYTFGINDCLIVRELNKLNIQSCKINMNCEQKYIGSKPLDIYYIGFEKSSYEYQLGSVDIIEGMAFLLEKKVFGKNIFDSPTLPYKTIQLLVNDICPFVFHDDIFLIALCELSLNCSNPMMFFIETLMGLQEKKYIPKNINEFIKLVLQDRYIECNGIYYEQGDSPYFDILKDTLEEFDYIFSNDECFSDVLSWIKTLFSFADEVKKYKSLTITNYFIGNNGKDIFHNLICNIIGTPVIYISENKQGYYFDVKNATDKLFILRVLFNFYNSLYTGETCQMEEYCKIKSKIEGSKDFTDENCRKKPSIRASKSYVYLCPYAVFWKYFGLPLDLKFK
jgi:hypothetical protein